MAAIEDEERAPLALGRDDEQRDTPSSYEGSAHYVPQTSAPPQSYYPQTPQYAQPQFHPANNVAYPRQTGVVTAQPAIASLNEASSATLQRMYRSNPAAAVELNGLLINLGGNMETRATQDISQMASNWNVDGLVNTLLLPEEEIAVGDNQQIDHMGAWIRDEKGEVQQKIPRGKLILTNKRILFVSCGTNRESALAHEPGRGAYMTYTMSATAVDVVSFFPISLPRMRSVVLYAEASSKWTSQIKGLLSCLGTCSPSEEVTQWTAAQPSQRIQQNRVIYIGAVLPPFNKTVNIEVHLEPSFSLRSATDFAAKLQLHVPNSN